MVDTSPHDRATALRTTTAATANSARTPAIPGRMPRRTRSGTRSGFSTGPRTSGSSRTRGRTARAADSSGTRTSGRARLSAETENAPGMLSPTAAATATAYPPHHAPSAVASGAGSSPCQCSPSVVTSANASRAPRRATITSRASASSGTRESAIGPTERWAPELSSQNAAPVPTACHRVLPSIGSVSQASTTGASTTSREASPVTSPTTAARHHGAGSAVSMVSGVEPSVGSASSPGSVEPGKAERRRSTTVIGTSVREGRPTVAVQRRAALELV